MYLSFCTVFQNMRNWKLFSYSINVHSQSNVYAQNKIYWQITFILQSNVDYNNKIYWQITFNSQSNVAVKNKIYWQITFNSQSNVDFQQYKIYIEFIFVLFTKNSIVYYVHSVVFLLLRWWYN